MHQAGPVNTVQHSSVYVENVSQEVSPHCDLEVVKEPFFSGWFLSLPSYQHHCFCDSFSLCPLSLACWETRFAERSDSLMLVIYLGLRALSPHYRPGWRPTSLSWLQAQKGTELSEHRSPRRT